MADQHAPPAIHRLGLHGCVIPVWVLVFIIVAPLSWLSVNELAWSLGAGPVLTERPLAAVHHRVMGAIQEWDNTGETIAYYQGYLRAYPDAPADTRSGWQNELDEAHRTQLLLLIKAAIFALVMYIPIGFILDRWYRHGHLADANRAAEYAGFA